MYPEVVRNESDIDLIQNSGIQFLDYDILVDWQDKDKQSKTNAVATGYFMRSGTSSEDPLLRLNPKIINEEIKFFHPIEDKEIDSSKAFLDLKTSKSLELFDGIWFPVPYLPEHIKENSYGPINWARARIVKVNDASLVKKYEVENDLDHSASSEIAAFEQGTSESNKCQKAYYRIVFAFDTNTQENLDDTIYFAPTERDVDSGTRFLFSWTSDRNLNFLKGINNGRPWVNEWIEAIFRELYRERIRPKVEQEELNDFVSKEHLHEAHYLNVLAFLGFVVEPSKVHFISNNLSTANSISNKSIGVSLILDIGNSRSCGIMIEDHAKVTRSDDDFSNKYTLALRDLNAPEQLYDEPFSSRIEFSRPRFEYDNFSALSGRTDAFSWPSMVRVGQEASNLAALRSGNEGTTGLVSPKRYLWSDEGDNWTFNNYSYQIKSEFIRKRDSNNKDRAYLNSIGLFHNSEGKAYFALNEDDTVTDNLESRYSYRSTMTFMLIEIFMQALVQMNSYRQRVCCDSEDAPRRLKSVILTTPPGMPAEERELYRGCVYEALGILWKALGFDPSEPTVFKFGKNAKGDSSIAPPIPDIHMDWNEAEAGQVVYIYNESQKIFAGHGSDFIKSLRRPMVANRIGEVLEDKDGDKLISTRIASLDIGGGTTDLVVKDYTIKKEKPDHECDIIPHEVFKDGFKIAGDDIIHDLIKNCIISRLAVYLAYSKVNFKEVLERLVGDSSTDNVKDKVLRTQFTQQILVKIAYKILFHLEHLDPFKNECKVVGTVRDFLEDKEHNESLEPNVKRMGPMPMPNNDVLKYVNNTISEYVANFSILDFKLTFDVAKINRAILEGKGFDICRILTKMGEVITAYKVDLLLLTGRASKLPSIRGYFMQRLNIPSSRIVPMHSYRCDSWYPFKRDGETIGDPKTTAAVGALLSYMRLSHDRFPNFRFYSHPEDVTNNAHFVGIIDNDNMIKDEAVLYKYESAAMLAKKNKTDSDEEESNFVPYKRDDDVFTSKIALELGYRLLDDATVEATPLYKIEAYKNVDQIPAVKKAFNLTYSSLDKDEVYKLIEQFELELQKTYKNQADEIFNKLENIAQSDECKFKRSELEGQLRIKIQNELGQVDAPSGIKGIFANKAKLQAEHDEKSNAMFDRIYPQEVDFALNSFIDERKMALEEELTNLLNRGLDENVALVKDTYQTKLDKVTQKLNTERSEFEIALKTVNKKSSPYPLKFIRDNMDKPKMVETFALESVELAEGGGNYVEVFRMYLKTISGAKVKYFMDSGTIDITALNPKNAI